MSVRIDLRTRLQRFPSFSQAYLHTSLRLLSSLPCARHSSSHMLILNPPDFPAEKSGSIASRALPHSSIVKRACATLYRDGG